MTACIFKKDQRTLWKKSWIKARSPSVGLVNRAAGLQIQLLIPERPKVKRNHTVTVSTNEVVHDSKLQNHSEAHTHIFCAETAKIACYAS